MYITIKIQLEKTRETKKQQVKDGIEIISVVRSIRLFTLKGFVLNIETEQHCAWVNLIDGVKSGKITFSPEHSSLCV